MFVAAVSETSQAVTETRYIGHSIKRLEDQPLLTGAGNFVADLRFADTLEAAFVRSPHAHARIRAIDTGAARRHWSRSTTSRSPLSRTAGRRWYRDRRGPIAPATEIC